MIDITIISNCREKTIIKNWAISTEYLPINITIGVGPVRGRPSERPWWRGTVLERVHVTGVCGRGGLAKSRLCQTQLLEGTTKRGPSEVTSMSEGNIEDDHLRRLLLGIDWLVIRKTCALERNIVMDHGWGDTQICFYNI